MEKIDILLSVLASVVLILLISLFFTTGKIMIMDKASNRITIEKNETKFCCDYIEDGENKSCYMIYGYSCNLCYEKCS